MQFCICACTYIKLIIICMYMLYRYQTPENKAVTSEIVSACCSDRFNDRIVQSKQAKQILALPVALFLPQKPSSNTLSR